MLSYNTDLYFIKKYFFDNIKYHYFLSVILVGNFTVTFGQSLAKVKDDGMIQYAEKKYSSAYTNLKQYYDSKQDNIEVNTALGICAYEINKLGESATILQRLEDKNDATISYYLGRVMHQSEKYKEAIKYYKMYLKQAKANDFQKPYIVEEIKRAASGIRSNNDAENVIVENFGETVNTPFDEFAPIPSPNVEGKIYFSEINMTSIGGLRNENGEATPKGQYCADMYSTSNSNGNWEPPTPLSELLNGVKNDIAVDFDEKGKKLYFFKGFTPFSGEILVNEFDKQDVQSNSFPKLVIPFKPEQGDVTLHFFRDSIVLFSSRSIVGYGGADLYYAILNKDNSWQTPVNLGPNINTPFDEICPFLSMDGRTLYFSSNNYKSVGGFDIFKSIFNEERLTWNISTSLGTPINSPGNDTHFRLLNDGLKGVFCSDRKSGYGQRDLYSALFKSYRKEQTEVSNPISFHMVIARMNAENDIKKKQIIKYEILPLYYNSDNDLLSNNNTITITKVAEILKNNENTKMVISAHSDNTSSPVNVDIYFTMKKGEKILNKLVEMGIDKSRLMLRSFGGTYPVARNELNGTKFLTGQKLNKRIEFEMLNTTEYPISIDYGTVNLPEHIIDRKNNTFKGNQKGLHYRFQVGNSKSLIESNVLETVSDPCLEYDVDDQSYKYLTGWFTDFAKAELSRVAYLKSENIELTIIPYINGIRQSYEEAKNQINVFPDLQNYIAKIKKPQTSK